MWDLIVSVPDHCLSFYFSLGKHLCVFIIAGLILCWMECFIILSGRSYTCVNSSNTH